MGSDMAVALGRATVTQSTLFGLNSHRPGKEQQRLVLCPGGPHSHGEMVQGQHIRLPQCRQTWTVLASQPEHCAGYLYGVNEHRVAAGFSHWDSRLPTQQVGLLGTDLVRIALERASTAQQAVDVMTDLIRRHGQGRFAGYPSAAEEDHIFLIADPRQAFVLEAAGTYWAMQEIHSVRAVSDISIIRQDWDRVSPGLAQHASDQGWWECDGNKLDFAGSLSVDPVGRNSALRRWGRGTYMLESQSGHIDLNFFRRLLGDHYDDTRFEADPLSGVEDPVPICRHDFGHGSAMTTGSFLVELLADPERLVTAWCTFGPPCLSLSFPVFLSEECLPGAYHTETNEFHYQTLWHAHRHLQDFLGVDPERCALVRERLLWLQGRLDHDAEVFTTRASELRRNGNKEELRRQARQLMQRHLEQFESLVRNLIAPVSLATV